MTEAESKKIKVGQEVWYVTDCGELHKGKVASFRDEVVMVRHHKKAACAMHYLSVFTTEWSALWQQHARLEELMRPLQERTSECIARLREMND